jgi:PAS domain S-box-containing protein
VVPVIALALLAAALLWGIQYLRTSSQWVDHTDQVIASSHELLKLIIDMETGSRGYLETGGDEFLQPYNDAKSVIDSRFAALNQFVADNPSQQARLASIRSRFDEWRGAAERAIALRRGNASVGYEAALQRKHLMDSLRAEHQAFVATEERLRGERAQASENSARLLILACTLLSLSFGGFLALFTRRRVHFLGAQFQGLLDLADKRAAELRKSEERYRNLFNSMDEGFCVIEVILDAEGKPVDYRFLEVNAAFEKQTGLHEATGKRMRELAPTHEEHWFEIYGKIALTGEPAHFVNEAKALNRYYDVHAYRVGAPELRQVAIVFNDFSDYKRAQEARARLAAIVETSGDAIIGKDLDGTISSWNRSAERLFGYSAQEIIGQSINLIIPPDRINEEIAFLERLRRGESVDHYETVRRGKGGEDIDVSLTLSPICDASGAVIGISKSARDITAQKQAEESLRASEQRWATTLQSIGDAVISTDGVGNIEFMNDVAQKLTGWTLPEAKGKDLTEVFDIVQEVTRIKPESPVAKVIRLGQVIGLANHTVLIHRDGNDIPIEDSAAPIRNSKGQIEGVVLVFHDVLEQRKVEAALRNSDRLATTGRLAATIAHEIHNPLDSVGNLLFLIGQDAKEDSTREYVATASRELARVTQMTQQMLSFQRDAAKPVPVKIGKILESVTALFERKIESAGIRLEQRIDFDGHILVQPGELRQIFANLVGNAIEAMGARRGTITLRAYESLDWRRGLPGVRVLVADDGPGIPEHVRGKIFCPSLRPRAKVELDWDYGLPPTFCGNMTARCGCEAAPSPTAQEHASQSSFLFRRVRTLRCVPRLTPWIGLRRLLRAKVRGQQMSE